MFSLVIGASASGKSEYAEQLVSQLGGRRFYLATMQPWDEECLARIEKHRRARAFRGFETIERYTDLGGLTVPEDANVLLECLSNLVANEMFSPEGGGKEAVLSGVSRLIPRCRNLTIVTNEVFSGGADYAPETLSYLRTLAEINCILAQKADFVAEVISGCANILKGERP